MIYRLNSGDSEHNRVGQTVGSHLRACDLIVQHEKGLAPMKMCGLYVQHEKGLAP